MGVHNEEGNVKGVVFHIEKDGPAYLYVDKKEETNPKDLIGSKKPPLWVVPDTAYLQLGMAMRNGANKYGPYNWREKKIHASIYLDAMMRHWIAWKAGEKYAEDSGIHHLAHLMATAAICLDAEETGNLIDDRPKNPRTLELIKELTEQIAQENK